MRSIEIETLDENQTEIVKTVKKIFKKIFRILEMMTLNNPKTQELMWKYKEDFVFEKLGELEQEGELELVLAIIDDSSDAIKYHQNKWTLSKTQQFVTSIHKRINDKDNFVLILEIYNKLIKFDAISFLKQSLLRLIMNTPSDIHSHDKETRREFEKSQNLQEILFSIIKNQEKEFTRDYFKNLFPLEGMFDEIDKSINKLNEIEENNEDDNYDEQDYDELRDYQYFDLISIYSQLYLHPSYSHTSKEDLDEAMRYLVGVYSNKIQDFANLLYDNPESVKLSDSKFIMVYLRGFFEKFEKYYNYIVDKTLQSRPEQSIREQDPFNRSNTLAVLGTVKKKREEIENTRNEIFSAMEQFDDNKFEEIVDYVHNYDENEAESTTHNS